MVLASRFADDPLMMFYVHRKSIIEFERDFKIYGSFVLETKKSQTKAIRKKQALEKWLQQSLQSGHSAGIRRASLSDIPVSELPLKGTAVQIFTCSG